jgi:large subunit ribosomal protein L9
MKVILLKDIKGTGNRGDVINASDGHARNYLIPRGLAKEATDGSVKELEHQNAMKAKKEQDALAAAIAHAAEMDKMEVTFKTKAGDGGRLFGSITSKDISDLLKKTYNLDIDKKKIVLENPIRTLGTTKIQIKVYPKVSAHIHVHVVEG